MWQEEEQERKGQIQFKLDEFPEQVYYIPAFSPESSISSFTRENKASDFQ